MTDHVNAPPELMPLEACDCCGVPSSYRCGSIWHRRHLICYACFILWYEFGIIEQKELKAERLRRCGAVDVGRDIHKVPFLD